MPQEKVLLTVADDHLHAFDRVARECAASGLVIEQQLKESGVITGRIDTAARDRLRQVKGVSAVEVEGHYQLPPPESDVQ